VLNRATNNPLPVTFFFKWSIATRNLHSFPTRRSSDLEPALYEPESEAHVLLVVAELGPRAQGHVPLHAQLAPDLKVRLVPLQVRSEEHTSELQSRGHLVCRLLLEKKKGAIRSVVVDLY